MKRTISRSANRNKTDEKPVALTLKIDNATYIRLSTFRARERKTAQEILTEALQEYLRRAGA